MSVQGVTSALTGDLYPPTAPAAPRPLPLHRFLVRFVRNPLRSLPRQAYEEGIIVRRSRLSNAAWVMEPSLVERILLHEADRFPKSPIERRVFADSLGDGILTSSGPSWRWQRRTAAPLFRPQALFDTVPLMSAAAAEQLARWSTAPPGGVQAIDSDMTDTTFRALIDVMFSGDGRGEAAAIKRAGAAFLERITWEIASGIVGLPRWMWHPAKRQMREAAAELRAIVATLIARRRQDGRPRDDLLGRLMSARDPETGEPMQESQLIDNALTFLAAGHETTAKALTWTLYLLARAPDWQQRVRAEVRAVAADAPVGSDHIERLDITRRVLKEAMRLYPPAPFLSRYTPEGATLAGETLPPGTVIVMPVFAIHRHRKLWEDPDRFDPDRFLPDAEARHVRTQFMPFGFGPRICIGASFAMLEATAILATLVRGARFTWDGRHLPEPVSRVTLKPKGGMPLGVEVFQGSPPMTDDAVRLLRSEPQLFVADMARAIAYYTGSLGFRVVFQYGSPPFYGQVARGEAYLNLRCVRTPPVDPALARKEDLLAAAIVVSDADALHAELAAAGAVVHQAPRTEPWGARTFITVDPDGNLVLFASEAMA